MTYRAYVIEQAGNTHEVLDLVSRNPGLDSLEPKSVSALTKILTETRTELKHIQEETDII